MRVGWLADRGGVLGGAELTQAEFRAAAPPGVEIVDCPPPVLIDGTPSGDRVDETCDRYVVHNAVMYGRDDLRPIEGRPAVKFWHDTGPWLQPGVQDWLRENTRPVCCSPLQADHLGLGDAATIPPPINLDRFRAAADAMNGQRAGMVSVGSWRNYGKAPHRVKRWAAENGPVDFFGGGPLAPEGSVEVPYDDMPALLASYDTFVFLPSVIEPFGRVVAEAWAAGCEVVTNGLVGAAYWLRERPDAIETAADDFWQEVLDA